MKIDIHSAVGELLEVIVDLLMTSDWDEFDDTREALRKEARRLLREIRPYWEPYY